MRFSRIVGILLIIAGVAALLFASYISEQVAEGKIKVAQGQETVNQSNQLFSANPVSKGIGQSVTGSAQDKINAGIGEIQHYEQVMYGLYIGGAIAIVLGGIITIKSFRRR
jgi:hypothetical protein